MAVPHGMRFPGDVDVVSPQDAYIVGRDKSITMEIASKVQPVPSAAVGNLPFRPVVLEGQTVQPRAESSGQAKWITWVVRATGVPGGRRAPAKGSSTKSDAA